MISIITTIGPASISLKTLKNLKRAGANQFRINLSHSSKSSLCEYIDILLEADISPSIDTQGAQLRVLKKSSQDYFEEGKRVNIFFRDSFNKSEKDSYIILNHAPSIKIFEVGDKVRIGFDGLVLRVIENNQTGLIRSIVESSGNIIENKAIDIIGKELDLDILTELDKFAIKIMREKGFNNLYASFISKPEHVQFIRRFTGNDIKIISKIETKRGVYNCDQIANISDEILIDRGDLSREIPIELIPICVYDIIDKCNKIGKPVNIATNILDSMMTAKLPSRAEISDIYNLISRGISGFVLAAEVAIGKHPVQSVALLNYLIESYSKQIKIHGKYKIDPQIKPNVELIGPELVNWISR